MSLRQSLMLHGKRGTLVRCSFESSFPQWDSVFESLKESARHSFDSLEELTLYAASSIEDLPHTARTMHAIGWVWDTKGSPDEYDFPSDLDYVGSTTPTVVLARACSSRIGEYTITVRRPEDAYGLFGFDEQNDFLELFPFKNIESVVLEEEKTFSDLRAAPIGSEVVVCSDHYSLAGYVWFNAQNNFSPSINSAPRMFSFGEVYLSSFEPVMPFSPNTIHVSKEAINFLQANVLFGVSEHDLFGEKIEEIYVKTP